VTARESALPLSGQGAGLGRAERDPRNPRKHFTMQGQKKGESYWVVCGKKVLLRTRDIGSARAFQNGLGWSEAQVLAVRVVWNAPLAQSVADHKIRNRNVNRLPVMAGRNEPSTPFVDRDLP